MDFVTEWGLMLGIFLVTGAIFQATKTSIGAEAGDKGFKGVFFVWGRLFLVPLGILLGWLASLLSIPGPEAFGGSPGSQIWTGLLASALAGFLYNQVIGAAKRRVEQKEAAS